MLHFGSQAMAGPSSFHPHNIFHQDVHVDQNLAQEGMGQPCLVEPYAYPDQPDVEEGIDYLVVVVFVKDPFNFFCQLVGSSSHLYALMEKLAVVYSGKELNYLRLIFKILYISPFAR